MCVTMPSARRGLTGRTKATPRGSEASFLKVGDLLGHEPLTEHRQDLGRLHGLHMVKTVEYAHRPAERFELRTPFHDRAWWRRPTTARTRCSSRTPSLFAMTWLLSPDPERCSGGGRSKERRVGKECRVRW